MVAPPVQVLNSLQHLITCVLAAQGQSQLMKPWHMHSLTSSSAASA